MFGLGVAVVAISFAAILFRLAPGVHPLTASAWRLVVAGLLLAPFSRGLAQETRGRAALAGVAYAVHFGAWVASLFLTSVLVSVTLVTTTPLMLAALALATGRDRPSQRTLIGLALGTAGVVGLGLSSPAAGSAASSLDGVLLALLGALAMAVYLLIARGARLASMKASLGFAGIAALVGGALLLVVAAIAGVPLGLESSEEVLLIVGAAALPQLVGHSLLTWALTRTTPTVVALTTLGEPIGAALLAAVILSEPLTLVVACVALVTLFGVALALTGRTR